MKKTFFMLILYGYIVFLATLFVSLIFPYRYFSELVLSFLPYSIALCGVGLLTGIVLFLFFYKKIILNFSSIIRFLFSFCLFSTALIFFLYSKKFTYFYNTPLPQYNQYMTGGLKIMYANVFKNNTQYSGIQQTIEKANPDVLLFVEFADHHYDNLKGFLNKSYPYSNASRRSKKYVGNMVFSKVKIENRADDFPQGDWRYAYFSLENKGVPIYFYLIHTSSPINYKYFVMRNQQIYSFFKDFSLHQETHRIQQDKIVVIGDFNISPWSYFYWKFAEGFSSGFINATRFLPIAFTWKAFGLPLRSHIDHLFINKYVSLSGLSVIDIPGSDHNGLSFSVR